VFNFWIGTGEKGRRLDVIFGKRAIGPVVKLLEAGTEQLREFEQAGRDAAGSLTRSAEQIQDTTTGSMKQFLSAVEGVQISLFKLKDRAIKGVIDRVTEWVRVNEKLIVSKVGNFLKFIIDNFDKIIHTLKTIGAVTGSLFTLIGAIKLLKGTMDFVDLLKTMDLRLAAIMAIVTALAVAAGFVIANWGKVKTFFGRLWTNIKETFRSALDFIVHTGPISWLIFAVGLIREAWLEVAPFFNEVFETVKGHFNRFVDSVVNSGPVVMLLKAVDRVKEKWGDLKIWFKEFWTEVVRITKIAVEKFREELGPMLDLIKQFFAFKKVIIEKIIPGEDAEVLGAGPTGFGGGIPRIGLPKAPALGPDFITRTEQPEAEAPRMVSPQQRVAASVSESITTEKKLAEVTIRDETGRAEVTQGDLAQLGFQMLRTGTF
jgi:hypothetical protein